MPYKSQEARREASRKSMVKKRQGLTLGINNQGITEQGLTDPKVRHLAEALITPEKRARLILLSNALDKRVSGIDGRSVNINSMVHYGYYLGKRVFEGEYGFTFDEIKELL